MNRAAALSLTLLALGSCSEQPSERKETTLGTQRIPLVGTRSIPLVIRSTNSTTGVSALTFRLDPESTSKLWPEAEGWRLFGIQLNANEPARWELDLVEARQQDRSIATASLDTAGSVDVVIAFRLGSPESSSDGKGAVTISLLDSFVLEQVAYVDLNDWAVPRKPGNVAPGWTGNGSHSRIGEIDSNRILHTWSWNEGGGEELAECAHPSYEGLMSISILEDEAYLTNLPLADWPDSVWMLKATSSGTR